MGNHSNQHPLCHVNNPILQAIIVEDLESSRDHLRHLLSRRHDIQILGEAASVSEAVSLCDDLHPNLIFLDVDLGGESGFSLLEKLNPLPAVIFTTGYSEHALRAFTVNAVDYLLKPIDARQLSDAIERIYHVPARTQKTPYRPDDPILLEWDKQGRMIFVANIAGVEADDNYTTVLVTDGTHHFIRKPISQWEKILPMELFCCPHRSLIVNLKAIRHLTKTPNDKMTFRLEGHQKEFELGRRTMGKLRKALRHVRQL